MKLKILVSYLNFSSKPTHLLTRRIRHCINISLLASQSELETNITWKVKED